MPKVTYVTPSGDEVVVNSDEPNLMQAAVTNQVEGILGDCGGVASCATCHVHIDPQWIDKVGPATDIEQGMLELEDNATDNSRLGCQVKLTPELDGLVVRVVGQ
ncbi:Putidaredoxin [Rubripirellula obstinata]|uniref:Putidaredoxin n=1 Tax=Rubripirellula obstinata TaxID=406547 RepID=A0A5B1CNF6_9BACT|nr:2Fe-2S iron-sulfur cluster-binding protein [Rubripirellula obstinata]KAA1261110.1 Putidaredoxin [Rubripirellula obstinata]